MLHWVSKDSLGSAIWSFWIGLIGIVVSLGILTGFNALAIEAERGLPARQARFEAKASIDNSSVSVVAESSKKSKNQKPVIVEALGRTMKMGGWGFLAVLALLSFRLWWEKRPYKVVDPVEEFVDKRAAGRTVK
jgi:hypothetical protein